MANKREYPRDMSFVDRQGYRVNPTRISYRSRKPSGEAYAFFDCNAPRNTIEAYLQGRLPEAPGECTHDFPRPNQLEVELSLNEVKVVERNEDTDKKLLEFIRTAEIYPAFPSEYRHMMQDAQPIPMTNLRYVIRARDYKGSNESAAQKLETVMNDIYLRFGEKKPFNVAIIGQDPKGNFGIYEEE